MAGNPDTDEYCESNFEKLKEVVLADLWHLSGPNDFRGNQPGCDAEATTRAATPHRHRPNQRCSDGTPLAHVVTAGGYYCSTHPGYFSCEVTPRWISESCTEPAMACYLVVKGRSKTGYPLGCISGRCILWSSGITSGLPLSIRRWTQEPAVK